MHRGFGQIVVELDPVALRQLRRRVDADRGQVHRDPAGHGRPGAADPRPAPAREAAQIAVGIADVEDCELAAFLGGEGAAIADLAAGLDTAALDDFGLDPRDLLDMALRLAARHAAVERKAGPGEAEGKVGPEADAGAVGEAEPLRAGLAGDGGERLQLRAIGGAVLVGASEMAHQGLDGEPVEQARRDVDRRYAEPVHAGVDHHVAGQSGLAPARDLLGAVQHGARPALHRHRHVAGQDAVEHAEAEIARPGRQRLGLAPGGDEEVAAAGVLKPFHRLARAEAVTVGLDRRAAGRAAAAVREPMPIGDERGAVEP